MEISFTLVGLCSDAVLSTFCSSLHGSKKLAPVTASSVFLKCFVLPHQTRPNVRAEYLVWENKQFECPGDLRECSFGRQVSGSVAVSKQQTVAEKPEESFQNLSKGRGVALDTS